MALPVLVSAQKFQSLCVSFHRLTGTPHAYCHSKSVHKGASEDDDTRNDDTPSSADAVRKKITDKRGYNGRQDK